MATDIFSKLTKLTGWGVNVNANTFSETSVKKSSLFTFL